MTIIREINGKEFLFELTDDERRQAYDEERRELAENDVRSYSYDIGLFLTDKQYEQITDLYVQGKYDCTLDYWSNIKMLINKVLKND